MGFRHFEGKDFPTKSTAIRNHVYILTSVLIIAQTMCVCASYPPPFKYNYLKNHLSEMIESKKNPFKQFVKANFV